MLSEWLNQLLKGQNERPNGQTRTRTQGWPSFSPNRTSSQKLQKWLVKSLHTAIRKTFLPLMFENQSLSGLFTGKAPFSGVATGETGKINAAAFRNTFMTSLINSLMPRLLMNFF